MKSSSYGTAMTTARCSSHPLTLGFQHLRPLHQQPSSLRLLHNRLPIRHRHSINHCQVRQVRRLSNLRRHPTSRQHRLSCHPRRHPTFPPSRHPLHRQPDRRHPQRRHPRRRQCRHHHQHRLRRHLRRRHHHLHRHHRERLIKPAGFFARNVGTTTTIEFIITVGFVITNSRRHLRCCMKKRRENGCTNDMYECNVCMSFYSKSE